MRKLFKERKLFKGGNYMRKYGMYTVGFKSIEIGKKVLHSFDHVFHVYLMSGLQKYAKKKKITSPF